MRFLHCIIFITLVLFGRAQGGFKKQYYFNNSVTAKSRDIIEAPNGNLLILGLVADTINNITYNKLTVCITDAQGNVLSEKRYGRKTFQYLDNLTGSRLPILKDANGFYGASVVLDSNNRYLSTLIRFDYNGDTLWQKKFYDVGSDYLYVLDIAKTVDNALIFTGIFEGTYRKILLIKTDLNGNELWRKKLSNAPITDGWKAARIIQDSTTKKLVMAGYTYSGPVLNNLILITDSLGNNPSRHSYLTPLRGVFWDLKQLKNKNFIAVGAIGTQTQNLSKSSVICVNINATLLWSRNIDTATNTNLMATVHPLSDGNFIAGGNLDTLQFHTLPSDKIRLMKMRPDGSVIWKKYYRTLTNANSAGEYLTSFNSCMDGGFVLSTYFPYKQAPCPYSIYKIDSTGCDSTVLYCQTLTGIANIKNRDNAFSVFPNPASAKINIQLKTPSSNSISIKLFNDLGEMVLNKDLSFTNENSSIDVNDLAPGVYLLQLIQNNIPVSAEKIIIEK